MTLRSLVFPVTVVPVAVPPMHEEVKERAEEQEEIRENAEEMRGVFGHEVERRDSQERQKHPEGSRTEPRRAFTGRAHLSPSSV